VEELDFWPAGDNSGPNFGWRCREAFVATPGVSQAGCGDAEDYIDPVAAFSHGVQGWCSAIGGYVYRGSAYPHLAGKYIFTDYCAGDFLTFGDNYALDTLLATFNAGYSSFGEDVNGELYVADVDHNSVKKIVDACPMPDPTVSVNDAEITASDADGWQWYLNGTAIPGADQQSWTATTNGEYAVLADLGGTCQLFSAPVSVIVTGIQGVAGRLPQCFRNPRPTCSNCGRPRRWTRAYRCNCAMPPDAWCAACTGRPERRCSPSMWPIWPRAATSCTAPDPTATGTVWWKWRADPWAHLGNPGGDGGMPLHRR
jgi:hypothetical protein